MQNVEVNAIGLFDGHSCFRETLRDMGFIVKNYLRSEIKPYANEISLKNFPLSEDLGDVTQITEDDIKAIPYKIHIIGSGSPCQSHSRNGKHGGFVDPRGQLFYDFINILQWVKKHNNPDVKFLFENVQMKKKSVELISESLEVDVLKIDSKYFSAQRRLRYYWTDLIVDEVDKSKENDNILVGILDTESDHVWYTWEEVNEKVSSREVRIDSYKKVNNIPVWSTYSDKYLELYSHPYLPHIKNEMRVRNATKIGYLVLNDGDSISLSFPNSKTRRGRVGNQKAATLDIGCHQMIYLNGKFREFSLLELERLQGLPDNYTLGIPKTKRKNIIGEGWSIPTIKFLLKNFNPNE